jgi:hypothetical protein
MVFWGANGITQTTHVPLGDSLLVVYFGIFLKYFEHLNLLKNLENFHHTIMLWFTSIICQKCVIKKKINSIDKFFVLFKNIGYNVFKVFLGIFHSLECFQKN